MSTPAYLKILGALLAGFLSWAVLPLVPLAYILGQREWRQNYASYQMDPPPTGGQLVGRNVVWLLLAAIPIVGFIGGYFLVDLWFIHGARVAAARAGMSR